MVITEGTEIVLIRSITPNKTQDTYVRYVAPTQTLLLSDIYISFITENLLKIEFII